MTFSLKNWRSPLVMLMIMQAAMQFSFAAWWVLIKNFAVDEVGFSGWEIGIQETVREIPGFLSFLAIYLILFMKERTLALVSLVFLGFGVAATGFFDSFFGLMLTTFLMSVGFHYYETCNQSLSLQWLPKDKAPIMMGKIISAGAFAALLAYGLIFIVWQGLHLSFEIAFAATGSVTLLAVFFIVFAFPPVATKVQQRRHLVLRPRYWLYYALTFMDGARRQIFIVFAALMMVEKFDFHVHHMAGLFLLNGVINMLLAPQLGRLIAAIGERQAMMMEYMGLFGVFVGYAFVTDPYWASGLYVFDHAFFAMAIATRTYFQKIADPADIAPTAGVAFTINHIAAVFMPVLFGLLWLYSPSSVFLAGAAIALVSFLLALMVPRDPQQGQEVVGVFSSLGADKTLPAPAE